MKKLFILLMPALFLIGSLTYGLEAVKGAQKDIQTFKQTMSVKLQEIDGKIDALRRQAEQKNNEVIKKNVEDYERMRGELAAEVDQLEADAKGNWKASKNHLATSIDDLNSKIQRALKE
ncbi:MAG: hypothetical protein ACXVCD_17875 [Pseudobdellovibrionaceae bacterium]